MAPLSPVAPPGGGGPLCQPPKSCVLHLEVAVCCPTAIVTQCTFYISPPINNAMIFIAKLRVPNNPHQGG